ncbi:MAG: DUF3488 domain-containing transglutaminase family protein [Methylotenera sp.]|nr:DUF3488 domain-containing transglutaminase family protein [Methylotenera sp.]
MSHAQTKLSLHHLQWLLVSLALILLLHAEHLPLWVILGSVSLGITRFFIEKNHWRLPKMLLLLPVTLLAGLGIGLTFHGLFGRDASLALLVIMLSLKLMETKTLRDYVLIIIAGYFLTANVFLFSQSILISSFSILPLVFLTATLIQISYRHSPLDWQFSLKLAGKLLLQAIPVMLILFILFPRIPGPLWGIPSDSYSGMTGLSDSLSFGNLNQLIKNGSIAFRVEFKGKLPQQQQLYWRGPVLWHQEGRHWRMRNLPENNSLPIENLTTTGEATHYIITLEPHNRTWLLMLDMPTYAPQDAKISHDYQVISQTPVRNRMRFEGVSYLQYQLGAHQTLSAREQTMALKIETNENPRTLALAQLWQTSKLSAVEKVNAALHKFRNEPFIYTLSPPILGDNPVDDFLFNTKKGFCEHYASSFVYLMRAAGVPARIVTGYQGGELNPNGNYMIVRQSDAHAWAEVWLQNQGWVRVDPTAAVSPDRIEQGISNALPEADELPFMIRPNNTWFSTLYLQWDAVNNGWNQWVLGYNEQKQLSVLSQLLGKHYRTSDIVFWLIATISTVMLITTYFLLRTTRKKQDALQKIYDLYLKKLKKIGITPSTTETATELATRVSLLHPTQQRLTDEIAETYNALRFGKHYESQYWDKLKRLIQEFSRK